MFLFLSHKRGVSSCQLARYLGVTQKTACGMLHEIREYMDCENDHQLCEEVEIDETFVGGMNKNRHKDKKVEKCQGYILRIKHLYLVCPSVAVNSLQRLFPIHAPRPYLQYYPSM